MDWRNCGPFRIAVPLVHDLELVKVKHLISLSIPLYPISFSSSPPFGIRLRIFGFFPRLPPLVY